MTPQLVDVALELGRQRARGRATRRPARRAPTARCHGPAATTTSAGGIGGVVAKDQRPSRRAPSTVRPLASTVQAGSAATRRAIGALRSYLVEAGEDLLGDVHAQVGADVASRRRRGRRTGACRRRRWRSGSRASTTTTSMGGRVGRRRSRWIRAPSYAGVDGAPSTSTVSLGGRRELEERARARRAEPHRRAGPERPPARVGQVERDVVRDVGELRRAGASLGEGEGGHLSPERGRAAANRR